MPDRSTIQVQTTSCGMPPEYNRHRQQCGGFSQNFRTPAGVPIHFVLFPRHPQVSRSCHLFFLKVSTLKEYGPAR